MNRFILFDFFQMIWLFNFQYVELVNLFIFLYFIIARLKSYIFYLSTYLHGGYIEYCNLKSL